MQRKHIGTVMLASALLFALSPRAQGGPLGLEVSLEAGGDDLLGSADAEMHVQPEVEYSLGDTGLRFGASWEIPFFPELSPGTIEGWEELELSASGVVITFGNDNTVDVDPPRLEGFVSVSAEHDVGDLSLGIEIDTGYAPDLSVDAIASIGYEWSVGPGTFTIGVEQNFSLYSTPDRGDTDFTVGYEVTLFGLGITFEIEPTINADGGVSLGARILAIHSL